MIEISIPGRETLRLAHLVTDYNGTIAEDGRLAPGVRERFLQLAEAVQIHVITADTFGLAAEESMGLPVTLQIIGQGDQAEAKRKLVESLGADQTLAMGNGANDRLMLGAAALGVCVLGPEGAATQTLIASTVTVRTPADALDLLLKPGRLKATLRI